MKLVYIRFELLLELRDQNDDSENGLSGVIIGGVTAGVVFIVLIILLCFGIWFIKHSKRKRTSFPVDSSVYGNPG